MQYRRSQAQGATSSVKSPIEWPYSSLRRYVKQGAYDSDWGTGAEMNFDENVGYE